MIRKHCMPQQIHLSFHRGSRTTTMGSITCENLTKVIFVCPNVTVVQSDEKSSTFFNGEG